MARFAWAIAHYGACVRICGQNFVQEEGAQGAFVAGKNLIENANMACWWVCSSAGRAAISKVAGRGFESLRTRLTNN
jgi:hypothetical protein